MNGREMESVAALALALVSILCGALVMAALIDSPAEAAQQPAPAPKQAEATPTTPPPVSVAQRAPVPSPGGVERVRVCVGGECGYLWRGPAANLGATGSRLAARSRPQIGLSAVVALASAPWTPGVEELLAHYQSGLTMRPTEVVRILRYAGWSEADIPTALCVFWHESRWRSVQGGASEDYGWTQINGWWARGPRAGWMQDNGFTMDDKLDAKRALADPYYAAQYALAIFREGGWGEWVVYSNLGKCRGL